MNDNEVKKLYNALLSKGYSTNDLGDEATFSSKMADKNSRKQLYDYVSSKGNFRIGDYNSYENRLSAVAAPKATTVEPTVTERPEATAPTSVETKWKPTEQEKIRMSMQTQNIINSSKRTMADLNEHMDNMKEYGINLGSTTKKSKKMFNPESGQMEDTYLTPAGNRYSSKGLADAESFRYRQAADMSVSGQLRKAHLKLQELKDEQERRAEEVHKKWEEDYKKNTAPLAAVLAADTYVPRQMSDKEKRAYAVAIRQTEERIKDLEEQKDRDNGVDVGFWRGFGRTMGDFRTWDLGMSDALDAMTMMDADKLTGDNATDGEKKAHDEMLGAIYEKQQSDEQYGGNSSFWNRAGVMTGYMPSFMVDFALTGGGFDGINALGKVGAKTATKVVGKEVVEDIAKQGFKSFVKKNGAKGFGQVATNWTIKALGTSADDLLLRAPLMTNTIQLGKTTADIIDRKLGDVAVDENGQYAFNNDKSWGDAVWQGEANSIIENYSEMFGTHLDPVMSLSNMSKLANTIGAKRLGTVLAKADAGALNGIMGTTNKMFEKMGVSDYVGEVSEEYYGQLWRTMLNLDDAYQQNADGTRTNLFNTGQFHGDIWGGMALSMGLMGAGKHTLNATNYVSMKHGVNKADKTASETLGADVWEPMKEIIDLTTNENIGDVADLIVNNADFTDDEKSVVLNYMERSLNLRGFNLGNMAQLRGGEKNDDEQQANESYLDGYNATSSQEMNDAKNMYDYQREQMKRIVGTNDEALEGDAVDWLNEARTSEAGSERQQTILDYINAKQVYDGMVQRVRDDIDGRIDQSNAMIAAHTNHDSGKIQGATMKQDDRKVYVVRGNLVPYYDNTGIDIGESDETIIIRDAETGALEQVSPDAVLSIDEAQDPYEQQEIAEQAIREQFAQEAADKIDGVVTSFNPGDSYTITAEDGSQSQIQIVADENGIVDNGDGTVNVSDGVNVMPMPKEVIQQSADMANIARVAEFEQQRAEENIANQQAEAEANRPQYAMNDLLALRDENGNTVRGSVTANENEDGQIEVYTESPINGKKVNMFTREELDAMLAEYNGETIEQPAQQTVESVTDLTENVPETAENVSELAESVQTEQPQVSASERIPKDEKGNPLYEQAETPDIAWDAIVEQTDGDEAMAQTVADGMVADKETALKKIEKAKSKGGETIAEKIASEKERKAAIEEANAQLSTWKRIAQTAQLRKMAEQAERSRIASEKAAELKAEQDKLRAEKEEADRLEREALNGVPDMVDDTPQDARARGYRRTSGHKVDRQQPLQPLQGKEVSVKFGNDAISNGHVAVIDAEELQPSHLQGVRNPAHFIDEAQPKERNDQASVVSARKIASNMRPEEITSSVTAYTGAPTVNSRGEVIQGNNRSDALREMWNTQKEQSEKYKQYLKDHADEFGVSAEDIDRMKRPVLVNMLDVADDEAIKLGQYVAQDTESGGTERIKPKNALHKLGTNIRSFANLLLQSADDETSFAGLVDSNGADVLKWMSGRGYITPTQYSSAFDSKGNVSAEAKNDLKGILYQSIFKGGSTRLEEMFNAMPAKAQRAILATAYRDYDSPNAERMVDEIQNSIRAYSSLSGNEQFVNAKTFKEARQAVESWKRQYQLDDVSGESFLPAEKFSNFALHLATMYKGESQSFIQSTFNQLYDLIQGTQEENLFEKPDNTPRSLAQAIYETLKIDYNGQQRSNVLVGDTPTSQQGQQGSNGSVATGERVEDGNEPTDNSRGTESGSGQNEVAPNKNGKAEQGTETAVERNNDEQRKADSGRVVDDTATSVEGNRNRGDIRVFEEGLDNVRSIHSNDSERNRREAESERLVAISKQNGQFITPDEAKQLGVKEPKRTGESVVYINDEQGKVYKVKDPYAKAALKNGVQPEDAIYEHTIHNLLFPETEYTFEGISEELGDARIVLSQNLIQSVGQPTKEQITEALAAKGLFPEDNYSFGNELVSVTDVEGDNVLLGEDGTVYFIDPIIKFKCPANEIIESLSNPQQESLGKKVEAAEAETNTTPTEAQKEAGNYKKGHVQVGTFDITIENPKGSERKGTDTNGKAWSVKMRNTYGYFRGTEGVDGDHIDVFLSDDIDGWNGRKVFVVDQTNTDGTFDEHKVMLGFNNMEEAENAYYANYSSDWKEKHQKNRVTAVNIEDFEKWIDSSHRKTKPFAEYKNVKSAETSTVSKTETVATDGYTVEPAKYTTKRGKILDMQLVKFDRELTKEEQRNARELAKSLKGWYDREQGGFMMRNAEDAQQIVDAVMEESGETLADAAPLSLQDVKEATTVSEEKPQSLLDNYGGADDYALVANSQGKSYRRGDDTLEVKRYVPEQGIVDVVLNGEKKKLSIPEFAEAMRNGRWEEQSKADDNHKLVSTERYEELKKRMRAKLSNLNMGIDPEILAMGTEMAVYHIEGGARKFAEYAKNMVADMGDTIRPYLKSFYNAVRDMPEAEELVGDMDAYEDVRKFDVANFDKQGVDVLAQAEQTANEVTIEKKAEEAKKELTVKRNDERRKNDEQTTTNTTAVAEKADAVTSEARSEIEKATTEEEVDKAEEKVNSQLESIDKQLSALDYLDTWHSGMRIILKDGRNVLLSIVMHSGEQISATQFSKPHIDSFYATYNGQMINFTPNEVDIQATAQYNNVPLKSDVATQTEETKPAKGRPKKWASLKVGDKVMYKGKECTIHDFDGYGEDLPSLDTGMAPVMYELPESWDDIKQITSDATPKVSGKKTSENQNKTKKKEVSLQQQTTGDLFAGLFGEETITENNKENENNRRIRTENRPSDDGVSQGESIIGKSAVKQRLDGDLQESRNDSQGDSGIQGIYGEVQRSSERPSGRIQGLTERKNINNNHSERGQNHAPNSVDARIEANIKAIELAQQLLETGEKATPEQMSVLRKFSGWGGLGKAFNVDATRGKLQELLGSEAYGQAVMSANSAYYTPAYVVDTLWDIAKQMGFEGGNILEGSAGIGNMLGQMPTNVSERSDIQAIEIDGTSGGILSLLYPDAKVDIQGFEQTRIPNGSVDLAITNVPFVTGLRVNDTTGDSDLSKKFHNIHDFCIAKNVRKLREGGIGIFITSNGTLDNSKKLRDWITNEGCTDFVGAFRMNNKTFGGTGVTSDVIVVRKRVNERKSANAIDVSDISGERSAEYDTGETRKVKGQEVPIVKQLSMDYNKYFIEHPENMAGKMSFAFEQGDTFRPTSKGLYPTKDKNQEQMLADFVNSFKKEEFSDKGNNADTEVAEVMPDKKIGEMFMRDGKLYVNSTASAQPLLVNDNKVKGHTKVECFNAYAAIKQALNDVLSYQTENDSDNELKPLLDKLNKVYDSFVNTYGHFNKNTSISFLRNDVDYPNVFSLEKFEETGDKSGNRVQTFGKTDVFKQRVVEKEKEPTPTNVKDGIVASMFKYGRIDVPYIASQIGESEHDVKDKIISDKLGFEDPTTRQMELSFKYLSGNVREKLRQAQENNENGAYDGNIKALQDVIPMDIPAHLIDFTLGSSWIDPKLYNDFVKERTDIEVKFTAAGGTWFMSAPEYGLNKEKNRSMGVFSEKFHKQIMGHTLIEAAIQNKSITVSETHKKYDGSTETITDKDATQACAAKIEEIRQDFKEFARQRMQNDSDMSARMERIYNDTFNNYVPLSIPDEYVPEYFGGASHKFKMRPHQSKAIIRGTMQPLLLAHEVGTGKTFTLISTAMEMRRLGTARKPMIVVQNATVGQFVASAKELYPNAKILTLEDTDRTAEGRKNFYAKIRYNDWDMIVVPQSTFEFIPDSEERQMSFVQDKIEEKMIVLEKMKEADPDGKNIITRQAEKEIADLEAQLAEISSDTSKKRSAKAAEGFVLDKATGGLKKESANDQKKREVAKQNAEVKALEMLDRRTDDVENFDDMGIDALLIDEAHEYKHLGFATAMQRGVKGVDASYSKKSQGVYLKTQAVLEKNNGRNVIFATGTPISNTAAEIWTFMRYLMPADTMKEYGIYYFDDFVRNFGNIQQMMEFTASGKFKEVNRFAGYVNLPELVRIWSGVSDTVLTKEAGGVSDKIPEMEGGQAQDLYLPQTKALRSIMKYVKAQLEDYEKMSGKEKKENSHIPLVMYGLAKAAAVDARLVDADAEDDSNSKTNEAVRQTVKSLKETADYKGTVAIFADNYQNKHSGFNIYDDIREKLIAEGIPSNEVVVIKSGMSVKKKLEIFDKVNKGEIRVVMGSTFTLGTGVNIQERLHTVIHLDAPNRPMDYTQRNGRILRQGNLHKQMDKPVRVLRFGVEDSLDVTAYQRLKTKGAIADSIMNGKQMMQNSMVNRVLEEEEDVFGDTVAQLSGSEYAMLKNNAEKNVRKYESRKKQWEADQTYIYNAKPKLKGLIAEAEKRATEQRKYLQDIQEAFADGKSKEITVGKQSFPTVDDMADFIKEYNKKILDGVKEMKDSGTNGEQKRELTVSIGGYDFNVQTVIFKEMNRDGGQLFSEVHRVMTYSCSKLGLTDVPVYKALFRNALVDITENVITGKDFTERAEAAERSAKYNQSELNQLLSREGEPFEFGKELEQSKKQYAEYSELMKKEMEAKEAKYAEMDKSVEASKDLDSLEDDDDVMMRDDDTMYRIREGEAPKKTGIGYKVFVLKDGGLYPPMVANPNGEATPVGVWLDADAAPIAGQSKTGRNQVKAGGKGTQGGSGRLAYRPGWHLGEIPYALQFNRNDENGNKELFPANFVWAEVEYSDDVNYQEEAMSHGMNPSGKFQHSLAGLPRVPENGSYRYRTNPNPDTDPWIITGAMRVNRLLTPTEVDAMVENAGREPQRRQDGAVTDAQINSLNAEINQSSNKKEVSPRALRKQMTERVNELAEKLHLDNVEIANNASGLTGKKKKAKGFYTKSTRKITIVIGNNTSVADVEKSLLHEAVAHYGLRKMFGEHFDTFLDNVFNNADEKIRREIVAMATKNGWDFRKATEEYLAGLAENTNFEEAKQSGWWNKVKELFGEMLHKLGLSNYSGVITDNEIRYVLWRSYENLKENKYSDLMSEAADIAKQYELGVGESTNTTKEDTLYRDGDPEVHERALARDRYEQRVRSGMYQSREALQDSMLGLKEAMSAILGKKDSRMEDIDGFENAYLGENRLSSVNKAEADAFAHTLFKPMLDEVAKLARNEAEREELTDYMMAKHGLERNVIMAERDAQKDYDENIKQHPNSQKTLQDFINEYRERDYAGLTSLTGMDEVADAESEAQQMVDDYENNHDTDTLWDKVNAVNEATLSKAYECGMMNKETFDKVSDMYEYYIPLRGFDEKTSSEAYAYLNDKHSAFNAPIKKAMGRKSKADDPFANMQSMAESAITQGNRNKLVKQKFLNFALNHPSDLVSVSDLWLQYDAVEDEWKPVFPDNIDINDTPEEVEKKMSDFEEKMKQLADADPDQYKHGKDAVDIPYRVVESRDERQHQVVVKRNGRDYVITINGNPRAAQALNGQTNPDNDTSGAIGAILRAGETVNRQLSAFYTTRNPDFIVSNFMRDMLYANTMAWIKESPNYALRFNRNFAKSNPVMMKQLLAKYRKGTLDMSNKTEAMFQQFMMNGGETGYANMRDIEQHKNDIKRELKKANGKLKVARAWSLLGEKFDEYNRAIENCARFTAFVTSREMGRTIDRSIYDAKEISVNFNKKGSGAKFYDATGQTKVGDASALVSGLGRSGFVFWNAAIQGTTNFGRQFKQHPAKAFTGAAVMFLLGAVIASLGGSGDDDDDDKNAYYNLPEYVRRSNILFRIGDTWISIPLPVEYRALYGMGELMTSTFNGKEHQTGGEIASDIAGQVSQILPIDFLEGGGGFKSFVPSSVKPIVEAYVTEKSWTGLPLYKDTPFNKDMPEWTKAYKSANKYIVGLSNVLNESTGGDAYTKGGIDINPAKVEYLLNGYFGGVSQSIDKMTKTAETIFGDREYDPRSILLVNRLAKAGDERTEYRAVNNEYFRLKEEHDRIKTRLKHYEDDTDNGVFDYAEKIDFLYNSPEYERYEIFEDYRKDIDALYEEMKEAIDDEDRKDIDMELNEVKKEMIDEMNQTRKRK